MEEPGHRRGGGCELARGRGLACRPLTWPRSPSRSSSGGPSAAAATPASRTAQAVAVVRIDATAHFRMEPLTRTG
jgi:hypothetical protein